MFMLGSGGARCCGRDIVCLVAVADAFVCDCGGCCERSVGGVLVRMYW